MRSAGWLLGLSALSVCAAEVRAQIVLAPPPPPEPTQTWTWQGILYQTTRNRPFWTYDSVEWATCAGSACQAPKIQCYFQDFIGVPTHPVGSTQPDQPTGLVCIPRQENDPWVYR